MYKKDFIFTSEYVGCGHPDKIADQISDLMLDICLKHFDARAKVAIETLVINNRIIIAGEINRIFNDQERKFIESEVLKAIKNTASLKRTYDGVKPVIDLILNKQSSNIEALVDPSKSLSASGPSGFISENIDLGAGDQGIMYGYACNDTNVLMPAPIYYAKAIIDHIISKHSNLGMDCKSQVSIEYKNDRPFRIVKILLSIQHPESIPHQSLRGILLSDILSVFPDNLIDDKTIVLVNPAGAFNTGGPSSDTGVTGRKIIVDTYGGFCPHGGGAFSGKDPTKVDRSASYMARWIAKSIVSCGLASKCQVQLAYVIGMSQPFSFSINTFGTGALSDTELEAIVLEQFDLSPSEIIRKLNLWNVNYFDLASNGHFGRDGLPWEAPVKLQKELPYSLHDDFFETIEPKVDCPQTSS